MKYIIAERSPALSVLADTVGKLGACWGAPLPNRMSSQVVQTDACNMSGASRQQYANSFGDAA
eukprot:9824392-Heterocapsa_arctica.AAC.1